MSVGYSGTPLAKKLGYKHGFRVHLDHAPDTYAGLVAPLPEDVAFVGASASDLDIIHLFVDQAKDLKTKLVRHAKKIKANGTIWVSWPKKAAKRPSDITEDTVRDIALPLGLVDVKVCAVDEVWSGLKLVIRRENRGGEVIGNG